MSSHDLLDAPPTGTPVPNFRPRGVRGIPGGILALLGALCGVLGTGIPVVIYIARMPDGPQWQEFARTLIKVQATLDADHAAATVAREAAKQHELDTATNINMQFENLKLLIKRGAR